VPGRPAWWSLIRPSPATSRLVPGGWALPPRDRSPTKAACGAHDRIGLFCLVRFSVRTRGSLYSFVGSGACWLGPRHLNPRLTNDDRDGECEGLTGSREPRRTRQFAEKHV